VRYSRRPNEGRERFQADPDELREAITDKTKALLFCTPSNPTGSIYSQQELEDLAKVISAHEIYVIADEIYEKVIYDKARHFSIGRFRRSKILS